MSNELPDELKMSPLARPEIATIFTYKTMPVSFSQQRVRFELPDTGILSSQNAYIKYSFVPNFERAFYPLSIGATDLIKRARLISSQGRVLYDQREWNLHQVVEKSFRDPYFNYFLERFRNMSNYSFIYNGNLTDPDTEGTLRPAGVLDNSDVQNIVNPLELRNPSFMKIHTTPARTQEVMVTLQSLFPALYSSQLPLGTLEEKLYIEIEWEQDSAVGKVVLEEWNFEAVPPAPYVGEAQSYASGGQIQSENCFLMTDHIVYQDPRVMAKIRSLQDDGKGLTFKYTSYQVQSQTYPAPDPAGTLLSINRDLGGSDLKLSCIKNIQQNGSPAIYNPIFGFYYSGTNSNAGATVGANKAYNYTINDVNLYPRIIGVQPPLTYERLGEIYSFDPYIPRPLYMVDKTVATSQIGGNGQMFQGIPLTLYLSGSMNIHGVNLRDDRNAPMQVGSTPVRVFYRAESNATKGNITDGVVNWYFVEFERSLAVSKNGMIMVSDFD